MAKILVAGDFCLNGRMFSMTSQEVESTMQEVKSILTDVDYSLVNLECSVFNRKHVPIAKCGPNLMNTSTTLDAIKGIGFNGVTLANNHIADYGHEAMIDTLELLEEKGLDYVGAGKNLADASKVLYKQLDTKKIAFINCCEHEFTIATEASGGANPLDIPSITRDILTAKKCADYVIVIIHGGPEYYNLPTPRMQDTYRFFVEMGADIVINHHQHCYSGYEHYQNGYIFYGLGNFCFDSASKKPTQWNEGYLVLLNFENSVEVSLIPYLQCGEVLGVKILDNKAHFFSRINELSQIISNKSLLSTKYMEFIKNKVDEYVFSLNLPQNRLLRKISKLGLLPSKFQSEVLPELFSPERKLLLRSYFQCESHNEIMKHILQNKVQ